MKKHFKKVGISLQILSALFCISSCNLTNEKVKETIRAKDSSPVANVVGQNKTDTVEIKEMKFQPAIISVAAGTKIVFVNKDMVTHDVTEEATKAWSSKPLPPNKSWSFIAEKSANYYCSIHAVMKGRIAVVSK